MAHFSYKIRMLSTYLISIMPISCIEDIISIYLSDKGSQICDPSKNELLTNIGSMLDHRLRRWPNIEPTSCHSVMFPGMCLRGIPVENSQQAVII